MYSFRLQCPPAQLPSRASHRALAAALAPTVPGWDADWKMVVVLLFSSLFHADRLMPNGKKRARSSSAEHDEAPPPASGKRRRVDIDKERDGNESPAAAVSCTRMAIREPSRITSPRPGPKPPKSSKPVSLSVRSKQPCAVPQADITLFHPCCSFLAERADAGVGARAQLHHDEKPLPATRRSPQATSSTALRLVPQAWA